MLSELYAFYVQTVFTNERFREKSGVYNPITVVVAESEDKAIQNLKEFLRPWGAWVGLPFTVNAAGEKVTIANLDEFGHGYKIRDYLEDPQKLQKYRELLDAYKDHYKRYDLQIYDERGEILWQNDYTQNRNFPQPAQPPKVITVEIPIEDADKVKAGVALVAEESENSASGSVLTSEYTTDENGVIIIRQSRLMPDGRILVRSKVGDETFSPWKLDPVFTEEAPEDGVEYVRQNANWKAIRYDETPKDGSDNLVKSKHIKKYVEQKVAKLYKYQGAVETMSDLPTSGQVIGDTYNVKQKSSIEVTIEGVVTRLSCDAGDNVVWNGEYWDNLSGFVDLDAIYQAIEEVKDPSIGAGYQTIIDNKLETDSKVVTSAINEVNRKITNVVASLKAGWNTVKLGKVFPVSWIFVSQPYCYTLDGKTVDFSIRNFKDAKTENEHSFEINVPVDCSLNCAVSPWGTIPAVYADYMLVSYYYTGIDGRDLDTVTDISVNGTVLGKTGYGTGGKTITDPDGNILAVWSGDNTGGDTTEDKKYYEQVMIDLNAVRNYTHDDLVVSFYAAWWGHRNRGYVHSEFITYTGSLDMQKLAQGGSGVVSNGQFILSGLAETYRNPAEMRSYVASKASSGYAARYLETYTPTVAVTIKEQATVISGQTSMRKAQSSAKKSTFEVTQLS